MFIRNSRRSAFHPTAAVLLAVLVLAGCSLPSATATPVPPMDQSGYSTAAQGELVFLNLSDGGSVAGTLDEQGQAAVPVQVEVRGAWAMTVGLTANGLGVLGEAANPDGQDPFQGELAWHPLNGAGEYTLTASAVLDDKSELTATVRVTVTGIPVFTATPPPLGQAAAQARISELIQQQFGVSIPYPAVVRSDTPRYPNYSRWIGSAYYNGQYYYLDLYDDTHYAWSGGPYADRPAATGTYTFCKPAGHYRILVLFVDYAGLYDPQAAVALVPPMADWLNGLYDDFARSQGLSTSPLSIEAEAAVVSPPPAPGEALTAGQILTLTGRDPAAYDIRMQIDLDPQYSFAARHFPGLVEAGGGLALQGCGTPPEGAINIWSSLPDDAELEGALVMDFNHELSHLFGMQDSWPFNPGGLTAPDGQQADDWIPYPMFGWTDTDGDGVIEILDPTPYGTNGPLP